MKKQFARVMAAAVCSMLTVAGNFVLNAQTPPGSRQSAAVPGHTPHSENSAAHRKSVALVLSGGGAKGFAHIPVLELIEELDIPVDIVIGNSAGAIIGSLYSAGYTPQEIRKNVTSLDWSSVFQDASYPVFEKTLDNHSTYSTPFAVKLGGNMSLQMGTGLLTGQKAYELFKLLTVKIPSYTDFDTLPIPFRAIAVDLFTGEIHVFSHGDLAEAVRASISIPALFVPFDIDGHTYIDGMARNNLPIDIAHGMGYECIIAVELQEPLKQSKKEFEGNPLVVLEQMTNMEQAVRKQEEYKLADIVLFPETEKFSITDYAKAEKIYQHTKKNIERYREPLKEIRRSIFQTDTPDSTAEADNRNADRAPRQKKLYRDIEPLVLHKLTIYSSSTVDSKYINKIFSRIQGTPVTRERFHSFLDALYTTGKYSQITARISTDTAGYHTLELRLIPQTTKNSLVLLGGNYEGTLSLDASSALTVSADLQYRGLTGSGSVFSVSGSFLNTIAFRMLYMQPFGSKFFMRFSAEYETAKRIVSSGWISVPSRSVLTNKKTAKGELGFPFNTHHFLTAGAGINHFDTEESAINGSKIFTEDFFITYTFTSLNHQSFPTSGFYFSVQHKGIIPIEKNSCSTFMETTSVDSSAVIPFGKKVSFVLNGYSGFNITERLHTMPELFPVYGFKDNDRRFFPQLADTGQFGQHKIVIGGALQFAPWNQITILGGQAFFSVSGAVGNVWNSFADLSLSGLHWRSSLDAGLRITEKFSLVFRIGAGTTTANARNFADRDMTEPQEKCVRPFISFDFGNIRY